VDFIGPAG